MYELKYGIYFVGAFEGINSIQYVSINPLALYSCKTIITTIDCKQTYYKDKQIDIYNGGVNEYHTMDS